MLLQTQGTASVWYSSLCDWKSIECCAYFGGEIGQLRPMAAISQTVWSNVTHLLKRFK